MGLKTKINSIGIPQFSLFIIVSGLLMFFTISQQVNYTAYILIIEGLCIFIAFGIMSFTHTIYPHLKGSFLLILGVGYGYVATFDLLHVVTLEGILETLTVPEVRTMEWWISARMIEALTLLCAAIYGHRTQKILPWHLIFGVISFGLAASIFTNYGWLLISSESGILMVNPGFEILATIGMGVALVIYILRYWGSRQGYLFWFMVLILGTSIISEVFFIGGPQTGHVASIWGHGFKALSFFAVHQGILRAGARDPAKLALESVGIEQKRLIERITLIRQGISDDDEGESKKLIEIEHLTSQVSAQLVQPGGDLQIRIKASLATLSDLLDLDSLGLLEILPKASKLQTWAVYYKSGIGSIPMPRLDELPWFTRELLLSHDVLIASKEKAQQILPTTELAWWNKHLISSGFTLPFLSLTQSSYLLVGIKSTGNMRLSDGLVRRLRTLGEIFTGLVLHEESKQALEIERHRLEMLALTSPAGIMVVDKLGVVHYSNPRAREILGYSGQEIPFSDPRWNDRDLDGNPLSIDQLPFSMVRREQKALYNIRHRVSFDGGSERVISVNIAPLTDNQGQFDGAVATLDDVTEEYQIQQELRQNRDQYRMLFNTMSEGFALHEIITNSQGKPVDYRFLEINPAMEKILGMTEEQVIGKTVLELLPNTEQEWIQQYGKVALEGISLSFENHSQELGHFFEVSAYQAGSGRFATLVRDVTEMRTTVVALREAKDVAEEANRAREDFMANISHELRTPINGILGMLSLIKEHDLDDETVSYLDLLDQSGQNLLAIVEDLLDFNRLSRGRVRIVEQPFSPRRVAETCLSQVRSQAVQKGLSLEAELPKVEQWYIGDEQRFSQILLNLLTNGIKYTQTGFVRLNLELATQLHVTVRDSGVGIDPHQVENIFEPFRQLENPYTKTHQGIGMGLSVVKQLVGLMKGTIHVESTPGHGSLFSIDLPLKPHGHPEMQESLESSLGSSPSGVDDMSKAPPPKLQSEPGEESVTATTAPGAYAHRRVLLVEDEAINRLYLARTLAQQGIEVTEAGTGKMAIHEWEQSLQNDRPFDLILMDIGLPEISGMDVITSMRNQETSRNRTTVCVLTAHAFPEDREKFLSGGADYYLSKPIRGVTLFKLLDSIWS